MTNPKISGPRLTSVLATAVWVKDNAGLLVVPIVRQRSRAPKSDVVIRAVSEQVPLFTVRGVSRHWDNRGQLTTMLLSERWKHAVPAGLSVGGLTKYIEPQSRTARWRVQDTYTCVHTRAQKRGQPTVWVAHICSKYGVTVRCVCLQ
jgi:hypothetical protein